MKNKIALLAVCLMAFAGLALAKSDNTFLLFPQSDLQTFINGSNNSGEYVADEVIVKFKDDKAGFKVLKVARGLVGNIIKEYLKRADVEYAEPNYIAHALMVPNDSLYKYQWNFGSSEKNGINMEKAWDITAGNNSVIVAVVDTGIAYETYEKFCQAPDLAQTRFAAGYNFVSNTAHANDDQGHGTHVAGTIAQSTNNSIGTSGIAFNTALMPVKVLNSSGSGSYSAIANGIRYAVDHGAKVINLSLGGSKSNTTLKNAIKYAYDKGVTVVAACGNDNASGCLYPAAYSDYVISVGATQYDGTKAPYSSYGANLNIVAPGGNTKVDLNSDGQKDGILQQTIAGSSNVCSFDYYLYQGTSMATPHVAGIAALLLAKGNATTPDQIKTAIDSTAKDLGAAGKDNTYGYGLANAYAALQWPNTSQPECAVNADCTDGLNCNGAETCQGGKCVAGAAINCSALTDKCNTGTCTEPGGACIATPKANGTSCDDGSYCNGAETCQAGSCNPGTAIVCNDTNDCTADTCSETAKACSYAPLGDKTACGNNGGICCSGACKIGVAVCGTTCWNGANQYLLSGSSQAKKFCKCAQGAYSYKSYKTNFSFSRKTVQKYSSTANNETWTTVSSSSYQPVSSVTCSDGKAYLTNQSYTYPK